MTPLELALSYAAQGWPVFPCDPATKRPLTAHGFKDATVNPTPIKMWWRRWPSAMVGVPTGPLSGFWVLDRDTDDPLPWTLPDTLRARTPRGTHWLFKWDPARPVKNTARKLGPGLDTRGEGGYIIAAGSVREDGSAYEWETSLEATELLDAPEEVYADLARAPEPPPRSNVVPMDRARTSYALAALDDECRAVETAPTGTRNDQLNTSAFKLATLVAAGALSESAVQDALATAAQRAGLTAPETQATIRSAFRAGSQHPRELPEHSVPAPMVLRSRTSEAAEPEAEHPAWNFIVTPYSEVGENLTKTWLIKGLFGSAEMSVVYGLPSCGKSVLMIDAACHVASGLPWFGHDVAESVVLYLAAERAEVVKRRLAAWRKRNGVLDIPLLVVEGWFDFLNDRCTHAAEVVAIGQWYAEQFSKPVGWIVIDTKQQTMTGGDPNSDQDAGLFIRNVDTLQKGLGAHVTIIDHVPHSAPHRLKGSGALPAASDGTFLVEKADGARVMTAGSKPPNDAPEGFEIVFDLESEVVGVNEAGEETTAPVVVDGAKAPAARQSSPSASRRSKTLPASAQKIMAAYGRLFDDGKDHPAPSVPGAEGRSVAMNDLREKAYEIGIGPPMPSPDEDDFIELHKTWQRARRKAFSDGMERLEQDGVLRAEQGFAWEIRGNLRGILAD